ncbi:hypothetical protein ABH963_003856 [Bacillus sp. RC55]|nr:hypothetical protein [Bacillus mycoides]
MLDKNQSKVVLPSWVWKDEMKKKQKKKRLSTLLPIAIQDTKSLK